MLSKAAVCFWVLPIAVLTNSLHIFALFILALYANPLWLRGEFHRRSGVIFFLIGLGIVLGFIWALTLLEKSVPREELHFR